VAVKFAEIGHDVTGIDIDSRKIEAINTGDNPLLGDEPRLPELLKEVQSLGRLRATDDYSICIQMDAILIAVETPFDLRRKRPLYFALRNACESLGPYLQKNTLIVIESKAGIDFNLCHVPERVMPGRLLKNIETLDRVIGGVTSNCAIRAKKLYQPITQGEIDITTNLMAEMVKTTENAYRDVQIAFANEIALLSHSLEINTFELRKLVNKSPNRYMLLPGAGVGGHCIPKDSWLLAYGARGEFQPKLLANAREINDFMPHYVADLCEDALNFVGKTLTQSSVTILGVAFLENAGDIRNSPALTLLEDLVVFNCEIILHDPYVPEINGQKVIKDLKQAVTNTDVIIITTKHKEYLSLDWKELAQLMTPKPVLIDGRDVVSREIAEQAGFHFQGVGKFKKPRKKNVS
jgi:UDP-N-acetyl-D-mannosaminuronic acid dehydrogenase